MDRCEFNIIGGCEVYSYFIDGKRNKKTSAKIIAAIISIFKALSLFVYNTVCLIIAAVIMKINKFEKLPPDNRVGRIVTYSCFAAVLISVVAASGIVV